ncbi:Uncharacterised protein [Bordetella ansorpii]|uniref:Antitoxin VbhA domain-containing protein n=1 Tax=Bordetella ansorpii TaxID=288768 RepID=A0A157QMF7_9BORD|nr:antitoxin VbhA family protein [Bordetella ansorpii]SAI46798.1 Uncharacterised protein [Bordetella ansorpii]
MLTPQEIAQRQRAVEDALASQRLEGLEPDAQALHQMQQYVQGHVELADIVAMFSRRVGNGEVHV